MKVYLNQGFGFIFKEREIEALIERFPDVIFTDKLKEGVDADIAIGSLFFFTLDNLEKFRNLKLIQTLSAGYDVIDLPYLKRNGIRLTNLRGVYSVAIAEDVISKILYFNKNVRRYVENMKEHLWKKESEIDDIYEKNVLILGAGSIGNEIAKRLKGFDAHIFAYDPYVKSDPLFDGIFKSKRDLMGVLPKMDYVILSLPLNDSTRHFFDEGLFNAMKKEALFINISRGPIVDQEALYQTLKDGKIRGAAIDVVEKEPLEKSDKLWTLENIYITPHVAFNGEYIRKKIFEIVDDNILALLNGGDLTNEIEF
jgi:phosphoglycerate dehydrogenase-like enzyme